MCPVEIVAYRGMDANGPFGDIEVFDGTEAELRQLRQTLIDIWRNDHGIEIQIVYQGPDTKGADDAITGLPRVSEEATCRKHK